VSEGGLDTMPCALLTTIRPWDHPMLGRGLTEILCASGNHRTLVASSLTESECDYSELAVRLSTTELRSRIWVPPAVSKSP
jgi:hypothetical protein